MRVLIVGGTGFIGSEVVRRLAAVGHEVTVLHRGRHEPALPAGVRHIRSGDAAVPIVRYPAEALVGWDAVVHMVLMGERDAVAAIDAFRARTQRLVVISSGDVYAPTPGLVGEDAPVRTEFYPHGKITDSPYGELHGLDKLLVERAVGELGATILRLPRVFGPRDPQRTFLPWIARMDDRRPILLGESHARFRWTHGYVDDVAHAIALAATHPRAAGRSYNVGEADPPATIDRVRALGRAASWQGRIAVLPDARIPRHLGERARYLDLVYDTRRIRDELGYAEVTPPGEAIARTVAWERQNAPPALDHTRFDYETEDAALEG